MSIFSGHFADFTQSCQDDGVIVYFTRGNSCVIGGDQLGIASFQKPVIFILI